MKALKDKTSHELVKSICDFSEAIGHVYADPKIQLKQGSALPPITSDNYVLCVFIRDTHNLVKAYRGEILRRMEPGQS